MDGYLIQLCKAGQIFIIQQNLAVPARLQSCLMPDLEIFDSRHADSMEVCIPSAD